MAWHQWIGMVGMTLIVGSYLLLQIGRLSSDRVLFSVANAAGALLILCSLIFEFNLPAFIVETFWAVLSIVGIVRARRRDA